MHFPVLPPGIDDSSFQKILMELRDIVGTDDLSSEATSGALEGPDQKTIYGDPYSLLPSNDNQPSGAVRPILANERNASISQEVREHRRRRPR
jgi:hypothetical protein